MKGEDEPVTSDEFVVRCIWTFNFKPALAEPIVREAFEPRKDEYDGISVYRWACLTSAAKTRRTIFQVGRKGSDPKRTKAVRNSPSGCSMTSTGLATIPQDRGASSTRSRSGATGPLNEVGGETW